MQGREVVEQSATALGRAGEVVGAVRAVIRTACSAVRNAARSLAPNRASTIAALLAVVGMLLAPSPAGAQTAPKAGDCRPALWQSYVGAANAALGDPIGVEIHLDPGCAADALPKHYMFVLPAWDDPAAAAAARDAVRAFVRQLGPASKLGLALGDNSTPRMVQIGAAPSQVESALQSFGATTQGATLEDLVRAAHNSYADTNHPITGISSLPAGKRHIVIVGHAGVPTGFEPRLEFNVETARDIAIDVDRICVGGGCAAVEGIQTVDVPDAAGIAPALEDIEARPAPTELEWTRVRGYLGNPVDFVFPSAEPRASRMGRNFGNAYIEWRSGRTGAPSIFAYRVRPLASGVVRAAGSFEMEGVTSAGIPMRAHYEMNAGIRIDPRPEQPSVCGLRAEALAAPDPVELGATADVALNLLADCPASTRPVDAVLAIDLSASMLQGERLTAAKTVARTFVRRFDFKLGRLAVLGMDSRVVELTGLGSDAPAILAAIDALQPRGDNALGDGLDRAREILDARRPGALPVIILISDGVLTDDPQPAADWAQLEGIRIVAACVNTPANCDRKFQPLASPASYYLATTDPLLLDRFFGDLGAYLGKPDFNRLSVTHTPFPIFNYTGQGPNHNRPQIAADGRLTWVEAAPLFGRTRITYPLEAIGPGRWPIAESIQALWVDSDGGVGSASIPVPELTVIAPGEGPCRPERLERGVQPDRLSVGETLTTTVSVNLNCSGRPQPIEIALVLDHSFSMRGQRLIDMRAAVDTLLAETGGLDARFALVAFDHTILAKLPLTDDRAAIRQALGRLAADGNTNIGLAIDTAAELLEGARPGARRFMVLLTDGDNSAGARPIPPSAINARDAGIEIIAICAGGVCDKDLKLAPSQPAFYFDVPNSAELAQLYRQIAKALIGLLPASIELSDQPGPALPPVPDSAAPVPLSGPDPQYWSFGFPSEAGISITQRLTAARPGRHPVTLWTRVDYLTADGSRGRLYVPPVPVTIDGPAPEVPPTTLPMLTPTPWPTDTPPPTATSTPTDTPRSTATPTPDPRRRLSLPWLAREVRLEDLPVAPTAPPPTETRIPTDIPTATTAPSLTPSPTRTRPPTRTNTPTPGPTRTPTATVPPAPDVHMTGLNCYGEDEVAYVGNFGNADAQLAGWRIRALPSRRTFTFPAYRLRPLEEVQVHSGPRAPETGNGIIRWTLSQIWERQDRGELINRQGVVVGDVTCGRARAPGR